MIVVAPLVWAAEEVQWVRVTVLLEPGPDATVRVGQTLVPGGIYSLAEVEGRGLDAIDREISDRIRFLGEQMRDVEASMRLATLLARQYYLALEIGKASTLPVIDLNPRLGIVISPQRFSESRAVCKVQFLEPEGPNAKPDFVGDPITLKLKDADLQDVLRTFSKITPFSVEIDPSIDRVVTVDLHDVPWDQALDLILRVNGLAWTREGDTLKVEPLNEMSRRKRVRTDATVNLPRDEWGSATIASRGDAENPARCHSREGHHDWRARGCRNSRLALSGLLQDVANSYRELGSSDRAGRSRSKTGSDRRLWASLETAEGPRINRSRRAHHLRS
jgi:hypothetical protein